MLDKEKLKHYAFLARLTLSEEELETFSLQLQKVLDYVSKINELDLTDFEPLTNLLPSLPLREDKPEESKNREDIINNFPDKEGNYLKVPKIL
jgi:aspartyl-tRNA(Asn)/glutamyl-tRNA(Gln) amidotransferase subunit C